jgi:hypothetical protein
MKLAQMERLAARLEFRDALARHDHDNPSLADDFAFLTELGGAWKPKLAAMRARGIPMAVTGGLMGLEVIAPYVGVYATVTGGATELNMIAVTGATAPSQFPIGQNVQGGKIFFTWASGTSTTAAAPGTYTLAMRVGPAPTNASPLFGAVSGAFTPATSATAAQWSLWGFMLIKNGGAAAVAIGSWFWQHSATLAGGGPSTADGPVGGTSASFDSTLTTTQLWVGVTHATSTTNTWVPQQAFWASMN